MVELFEIRAAKTLRVRQYLRDVELGTHERHALIVHHHDVTSFYVGITIAIHILVLVQSLEMVPIQIAHH